MYHPYKFDYLRILQIDGSEIFYYITKKKELKIENPKDEFDSHFCELLAPNLDLIYLSSIEKLKVSHLLDEQYSYDLISVTFEWDLKIGKRGGRITYQTNRTVAQTVTKDKIRDVLYTDGFVLNGKKYVRYKRSSGAARSGNCLFIKESLFKVMDQWSNTGIDPKDCYNNLVSFESYKALSLSGLIATLKLKPHNILFVKDIDATVKKEKVLRTFVNEKNELDIEEKECNIKNKIWDGEGLLDYSIFSKTRFKKKGMMLLRNRFFKSCVFNTNLQDWFKENKITRVNQLNGITFAKDIKDVKLVVTESSLKYIKMLPNGELNEENVKKWCDTISNEKGESLFGIVKTDKPQRYFYGDMVETTYQMLNTIHLTDQKTRSLMTKNIDYLAKIREIKKTPEYLRFYLKGEADPFDDFVDKQQNTFDDSEDVIEDMLEENIYTYKKLVCDLLLEINKDVIMTQTFKYFVYNETISSLAMRLYDGRVLVEGTYATLFGNPYELLLNIINKFEDQKSRFLHKGEICSPFFENGMNIVGSRAPHVTMGNLLCAKNVRNKEIEKWFNLTREIVIVDAIENNVQQRLNGADYDSDTMLLTNNPVLYANAKENYNKFLVPYSDFDPINNKLENLDENESKNILLNLSKIDHKISNNLVGLIINYSQLLNSYYWDRLNRKDKKNLPEIYRNIAKLAVLSNVEIDSAKRSFSFDTADELEIIEKYLDSLNLISLDKKRKRKQPLFFHRINLKNESHIGTIENHIRTNESDAFRTTMDFIWKNIYHETLLGGRFTESRDFAQLTDGPISQSKRGGKQYKIVDSVIEDLKELYVFLGNYYSKSKDVDDELRKRDFKHKMDEIVKKIKNYLDDVEMVRLIVIRLEKDKIEVGKDNQVGSFSNYFLLLFYLICHHHKDNARVFLSQLFISNTPVYQLKHVVYSPSLKFTLFDKYGYRINRSAVDKLVDAIWS